MQSFVFLKASSIKEEYLYTVQRPFHKEYLARKSFFLAFLNIIFFQCFFWFCVFVFFPVLISQLLSFALFFFLVIYFKNT